MTDTNENITGTTDFAALRLELLEHLVHHVMPFWTDRAVDPVRGGIYTFIEEDGSIRSRRKHLVSNTRALWTFSALVNRIENRPVWRSVAEGIFEFLMRCGRDDHGLWVYVVNEDERVVIGESSIVTDAFAIGGLTEFYRMTGNEKALQAALETARLTRERLARPGTYKTDPYPTPEGMVAQREAMQFSRAFCELGAAAGDDDLVAEGLRYARQVLDRFRQLESGYVLEYIGEDGQPRDTPAGRTMVPGHAIESLWFQMHNFAHYGGSEAPRAKEAARSVKPCLERGWDPEYGGILLGVDVEGKTPVYWKSAEMKRWWPVTEALPALLLAYEQLGAPWCLEWFDRVRRWAFKHFPNSEHGDWHQNLSRDGTPIPSSENTPNASTSDEDKWAALDLAVKDPFHLPRGLIVSIEALDRLQTHNRDA